LARHRHDQRFGLSLGETTCSVTARSCCALRCWAGTTRARLEPLGATAAAAPARLRDYGARSRRDRCRFRSTRDCSSRISRSSPRGRGVNGTGRMSDRSARRRSR
jgi:hypothetical protein